MLRGKSDWSPDFVTKDKDKDKECVTRRPDFGHKKDKQASLHQQKPCICVQREKGQNRSGFSSRGKCQLDIWKTLKLQ